MSADNYLLIDRETFKVYMGFASQEYTDVSKMHLEGQGQTLEEAIDIAQHIQHEEIIECGIYFT